MYYFCTYFDHRYLARGLALYRSLKQHCPAFRLWTLCMDQEAYDTLMGLKLSEIHPIALEDFERGDDALLRAKQNRTLVEYYFTCTPSLALFVLNHYSEVDLITYLDADLFFFSDPAAVYAEIGAHSIAIIEHRFSPPLRHFKKLGIYNVGWISFRHDGHADQCLRWWREQCNEWCYDRLEDGRFADQKYLDVWPTRFKGVTVLLHKGANLAPWNLANYKIHLAGDQILVDEQPLIFFHFHSLKRLSHWLYDSNLAHYAMTLSRGVRRLIYRRYLQSLWQAEEEELRPLRRKTVRPLIRHEAKTRRGLIRILLHSLLEKVRGLQGISRGLLARQYLLVIKGKVL